MGEHAGGSEKPAAESAAFLHSGWKLGNSAPGEPAYLL